MNAREPGAPWTLVAFAGVALIACGLFGIHRAANTVVWILAATFMVFLIRHLAFAASALSSAPLDL